MLNGQTVARTAHFALHRLALGTGEPPVLELFAKGDSWVGAMVPKRWARRAVTRNAIKRQVYAVSQTSSALLVQAAHVVRLRSGFDRSRFHSASSDVLKQAVRAELLNLFGQLPPQP